VAYSVPDFGINFKKAREGLGVSLEDIAAETRIGSRFLIAIEKEEFHILPGGIFSRGFIRTYADRLGLDSERAVSDFLRLTRTPEPAEASKQAKQPKNALDKSLLSPRLWPFAATVGLILAALTVYLLLPDQTPEAQAPASPAALTPRAPEESAPTSIAPDPGDQATVPEPPASTEPAPVAPVVPKAPIDVEMRATEPTWIRVAADGGTVVAGETLQPGDTRRYTAQRTFDLKVGNAAGLILMVNDRSVPSLGPRDEVREFTITPESAAKLNFISQ
jgi:cytoskeletal protein RodZ